MKNFKKFKSKSGQYRFNLVAKNGEIILTSEGYTSKRNRNVGINSVRKNSQIEERYTRLTAKDGSHYFNLTATNGQIIGTSEMYSTEAAMENGILSVRKNA